jgi:hypothetical protein
MASFALSAPISNTKTGLPGQQELERFTKKKGRTKDKKVEPQTVS